MGYRVLFGGVLAILAGILLSIVALTLFRTFQKKRAVQKAEALAFARVLMGTVASHIGNLSPVLQKRVRMTARIRPILHRGGRYWWGTDCIVLTVFFDGKEIAKGGKNEPDATVAFIRNGVVSETARLFRERESAVTAQGLWLVHTKFNLKGENHGRV
jgi:hypothetical protein